MGLHEIQPRISSRKSSNFDVNVSSLTCRSKSGVSESLRRTSHLEGYGIAPLRSALQLASSWQGAGDPKTLQDSENSSHIKVMKVLWQCSVPGFHMLPCSESRRPSETKKRIRHELLTPASTYGTRPSLDEWKDGTPMVYRRHTHFWTTKAFPEFGAIAEHAWPCRDVPWRLKIKRQSLRSPNSLWDVWMSQNAHAAYPFGSSLARTWNHVCTKFLITL